MSFSTVVNCMDGRVQLPVIRYMQKRFSSEFIDSITEPGPNLILAEGKDLRLIDSVMRRINISLDKHRSSALAVVGHHDCAGNPALKKAQIRHIIKATELLSRHFKEIEIIGLWVDENWEVREV